MLSSPFASTHRCQLSRCLPQFRRNASLLISARSIRSLMFETKPNMQLVKRQPFSSKTATASQFQHKSLIAPSSFSLSSSCYCPKSHCGSILGRHYAQESSSPPLANKVKLSLQTPTTPFMVGEEVDMVGIPGAVGDFVIAPNASPVFTELRSGVLQVRTNGIDTKYFVSGGFATSFEDSSVKISVGECIRIEDVDVEKARQILAASQAQITSSNEEERILAQISIDTASAMIKAVEMK